MKPNIFYFSAAWSVTWGCRAVSKRKDRIEKLAGKEGLWMSSVYPYSAKSLSGEEVSLKSFQGQVLLIVNTASACGFTPQYQGLEELHRTLSPLGFTVLGFPCNQFGNQEPGDAATIAAFCDRTYGVTFPLFAKIDVKGQNAHPLFAHLQKETSGLLGSTIKWNFTKFLIDRKGEVVGRYMPMTSPASIRKDIEKLLPPGGRAP